MSVVPRNTDGSYTLYSANGMTVTLTFPADPASGFTVETKDLPATGLPGGYTWLLNFGIKNSGGQYLPSVTYNLSASPATMNWVVFYKENGQDRVKPLQGRHTSPGDPPIGYG